MSAFLAVLRVAGSAFDVDRFLRGYPKFRPDATWRLGESTRGRRPATTSGFTITVGEDDASLSEVDRFCDSKGVRRMLADAQRFGAELLLDVATEVGSKAHYTSSVSFAPAQLRVFGDLGITLVVSGYPVSDDEEKLGTIGGDGHVGSESQERQAAARGRSANKRGKVTVRRRTGALK